MIWVGWRQQRTETLIAAGVLLLIAAFLVPSGLDMAHAYDREGIAACLSAHPSPMCADAIGSFTSRFEAKSNLVAWLTLLPGLLGVLLAAPLVLELENGTYRLAWTQSITRRAWIAWKLGLAVGAALAAAAAVTLLLTWWRAPLIHLEGRMEQSAFDSQGIVVVGYTLFALGLATAVGVIWRRAVPALVVGFGVYFAARLFVDFWLRQRLVSPLTATWRDGNNAPTNLNHAWVLSEYPSNALGHLAPLPFECARVKGNVRVIDPACMLTHGGGFTHAVYEPASRFWLMQGVETALFGGVALALLAFSAWWIHSRRA